MKRAVMCIMKGKAKGDGRKQESAIEAYCFANDIAIVSREEYAADGFGEIAYGESLKGSGIDAVVVADSANISGDVLVYYAYKAVLKRRHIDLVVANDSIGTAYKLYKGILEKFIKTQYEIEIANEPIRKPYDRRDKAARGEYIGGNAPMGYKVENRKLIINEEEVPVVLFVMDRKHSGKSKLSTVDALNQNGYKTRNGKPFVISTVQSIWNNEEFYRGYYKNRKDGEWIKGQHEAIIKD